jgi:hypothetical protein
MIAARNDRTIRDVGQSVVSGDKHFEIVKECVYLECLITPTNDVSLDIERRIQAASRCFFALRKHLQSSYLSRQTKFTVHKTAQSSLKKKCNMHTYYSAMCIGTHSISHY